MSKLAMMLKLLYLLQNNYMMSSKQLADTLGMTPRNVKAYIVSMRDAGVPIEGISGKSGGYYFDGYFDLKSLKLDDLEYTALLLAEEVLTKDNGFVYENEIKTGFAKIKTAQRDEEKIQGITKDSSIFCRGRMDITKGMKQKLVVIRNALLNRNRIEMLYENPIKKENTTRIIDPYNLIYRDSSWYLVGYCHLRGQIRMFKIMRVKELTLLNETFKIPKNFTIQNYMKDTFNLIKGKEYNVEIVFYHPASVWVSEKCWLPTQQIEEREDGSIKYRVKVKGLDDIKHWVMSYGSLAKVIKPKKLVTEIKKEIELINNQYS